MLSSGLSRQADGRERDSVVEVLRLGACLIVVFYHLIWAFAPMSVFGAHSRCLLTRASGNPQLLNNLPFDLLIAGNFAVCLFFILSSYVLAKPVLDAKSLTLPSLLGDGLKRYIRLALPLAVFTFLSFICFKLHLYENLACVAAKECGSRNYLICCNRPDHLYQTLLLALIYPFDYAVQFVPPAWTIGIELAGSYLTYALAAVMSSSSLGFVIGLAALIVVPGYLKLFVVGTLLAYAEKKRVLDYDLLRTKLGKHKGFAYALVFTVCIYLDAFPWYADAAQINQFASYFNPLTCVNDALIDLKIPGGLTSLAAISTFLACKLCLKERDEFVDVFARFGKHTYVIYLSHLMVLGTVSSAVYLACVRHHLSSFSALIWAGVTMSAVLVVICLLCSDTIDRFSIHLSRLVKRRYLASLGGGTFDSSKPRHVAPPELTLT